jgi:hypothetical protein
MRGNRLILTACESSAADFAQWIHDQANEELHASFHGNAQKFVLGAEVIRGSLSMLALSRESSRPITNLKQWRSR